MYEVSEAEIAVVAWSGGGAPAHPRFSLEEGLCGAAVASRRPVVVDDVAADPRYLTTFGSTRSELVVPVSDGERVVGLIDVESDRRGAFRSDDVAFIAACGSAARPLWQREAHSITRAAPASASPDEQRPELAR